MNASKIIRICLAAVCVIAIVLTMVMPFMASSEGSAGFFDWLDGLGAEGAPALFTVSMILFIVALVLLLATAILALIFPVKKTVPGIIGIIAGVLLIVAIILFICFFNDMFGDAIAEANEQLEYMRQSDYYTAAEVNEMAASIPGIGFGMYINIGLGVAAVVLALILLLLKDHAERVVTPTPAGPGYGPYGQQPMPPRPMANAHIIGLSGVYQNASFDVSDGRPVMFGRDTNTCSVIFDQYETAVSRQHCIVTYLPNANMYSVRDMSKNGTFIGNINNRMPNNVEQNVQKGTIIYIGSSKNSFKLD